MLIISALILTALTAYALGCADRPGASQREWDAYQSALAVLNELKAEGRAMKHPHPYPERSKAEEAAQ